MDQIEELLTRAVDTIYPTRQALEDKLRRGEKLTLYLGVDPTGAQLHIGHTIALRKLAQFQQTGHKVILLIGDFTGRIGDPTGKDKTRVPLTPEQLADNARTYQQQAAKILDFNHPTNPVELKYNSAWLAQLTFADVIKVASHFTVQQMLERDMFEQRWQKNKPIALHEFFYPLMQGYDSVAMNVDLEVGGTDQTFNMLAGRTLQRLMNQREKFVLTVPLLIDAQGVKIGKTAENVIAITAPANDLYGMIMALSDEVIVPALEFCTDLPMTTVRQIEQQLAAGANPRDAKMQLARAIVTLYHNAAAAVSAEQEFQQIFVQGGKPTDRTTMAAPISHQPLDILVSLRLASSKSEAQRLIKQGGVQLNDHVVTDWQAPWGLRPGDTIQVGKRKFIQISA
ncbi:MAG: tyrosine--tRNA ligase [Candidatus Kerfeldbacteria bacterium]|nr:tyrosine--tRNA ligase [Candidatus Kerfeldbacteria bacterium]